LFDVKEKRKRVVAGDWEEATPTRAANQGGNQFGASNPAKLKTRDGVLE
jgi:hypothetical protein